MRDWSEKIRSEDSKKVGRGNRKMGVAVIEKSASAE